MARVVLKNEWSADVEVLDCRGLTKAKGNVAIDGVDRPEEKNLLQVN